MALKTPFWPNLSPYQSCRVDMGYPSPPRVFGGSAAPVFFRVKKWLSCGILFTRKKHKKLLTSHVLTRFLRFQLRDKLRRSFSPKIPQHNALLTSRPQLRERSRPKKSLFYPDPRVPAQKRPFKHFYKDLHPLGDFGQNCQKPSL